MAAFVIMLIATAVTLHADSGSILTEELVFSPTFD